MGMDDGDAFGLLEWIADAGVSRGTFGIALRPVIVGSFHVWLWALQRSSDLPFYPEVLLLSLMARQVAMLNPQASEAGRGRCPSNGPPRVEFQFVCCSIGFLVALETPERYAFVRKARGTNMEQFHIGWPYPFVSIHSSRPNSYSRSPHQKR